MFFQETFRSLKGRLKSSRTGLGSMIALLLIGAFHQPALADEKDDQELAAIKLQIRQLMEKVDAIEQRKEKEKSAVIQTNAERQLPPSSSSDSGAKSLPSTPHWMSLPPPNTAPIKASNQNSPPHSSIDLKSSSPAAITQTAVDRLPPVFSIGNVSVKLGGFVELSNIWRSSNMTSGPATAWNNFPYANSPNHGLDEERLSSQLTRSSVLLEADPTKSIQLQAYLESDFGGAANTTNSIQISGYTPRLRQGYFTFTQNEWGFHVLMGQAWSLVTNYSKGLLPRQEQLPPVTDNNQIPGISFTRVPQIRFEKDWNKKYWVGLSLEDPQATVAFSSSVPSGGRLPAAYGETMGPKIFYENSGGVLLNSNTVYTYNPAPDIVLKTAADTRFGHYEIFGLARWFRSLSVPVGATTSEKHTHFGGGIGAGMTVPLIADKLQLTGNILAGEGIGRYGPTMLPDTSFNSRGLLSPVPEIIGAMGLIGHPTPSILLYSYGGVETAGRRRYMGADGSQYGYGIDDQDLSGCNVEFGVCNAQTHTLASFTLGGWWHMLHGSYGSVMGGLQYTYIKKFAFSGANSVRPTTSGNTLYVTFRYFPFQ